MLGEATLKINVDTTQAHAALDSLALHVNRVYTPGYMARVYDFCKGRTTFFALVFTVAGVTLAFQGKLTVQFVALVGAIQALIVAHSTKEDIHERFLSMKSKVTPPGS